MTLHAFFQAKIMHSFSWAASSSFALLVYGLLTASTALAQNPVGNPGEPAEPHFDPKQKIPKIGCLISTGKPNMATTFALTSGTGYMEVRDHAEWASSIELSIKPCPLCCLSIL